MRAGKKVRHQAQKADAATMSGKIESPLIGVTRARMAFRIFSHPAKVTGLAAGQRARRVAGWARGFISVSSRFFMACCALPPLNKKRGALRLELPGAWLRRETNQAAMRRQIVSNKFANGG